MSNFTVANNRFSGKELLKLPYSNIVKSNGKTTRYYSSVDAEIFFEEMYIDECVNIAFSVQQQTMPLYGYNSYTFDDVALGSRIVSGSFSVNFTAGGFLIDVLNVLSQSSSRKSFQEDIPVKEQNKNSSRSADKLPSWDKGFDIIVAYGSKTSEGFGQNITLKTVQITDYTQELNYVGQPVLEVYQFIAKDVIFGLEEKTNSSEDFVDPGIESDKDNKEFVNQLSNITVNSTINLKTKMLEVNVNNVLENVDLDKNLSFLILDNVSQASLRRNALMLGNNKYSYKIEIELMNDINKFIKNKNIDVIKINYELKAKINNSSIKKTFNSYAKLIN